MRIAIVGNSGSGKSTLARKLSDGEQVTVLDLDTVAWEPGKIAVSRSFEEAASDVREFCRSRESWIIEGCYARLIEASFELEPLLLVLDPGVEQCLQNCRSRPWEPHKYASKEEQDKGLAYLLEWVEEYYTRNGDMSLASHKAVFEKYSGPKKWLTEIPRSVSTILGP